MVGGWFRLDPDRFWLLRDAELLKPEGAKLAIDVDYGDTIGGLPSLKEIVAVQSFNSDEHQIKVTYEYQFTRWNRSVVPNGRLPSPLTG